MIALKIYNKAAKLPLELQRQVLELVEKLEAKTIAKKKPEKPKQRPLGIGKGWGKMKDNFDDPIPGMEEYM